MLGSTKETANTIYLIDFGLAKCYIDPETGEHIPEIRKSHTVCSVRYMSLNGHQLKEQSRRDDLESLGYVFLHWLTQGQLPWMGIKSDNEKSKCRKIYLYKNCTPIEKLCHGFPAEFANYLR